MTTPPFYKNLLPKSFIHPSPTPSRKGRGTAPRPAHNDAWAGESHPAAVMICAIGFFMIMLLSEQTLNILGIPYGKEEGSALFKIHPGNFFILLSFMVLICSRGNPFAHIVSIARQHSAFFSLLVIYILILIYWGLRGPKGIGFILDNHIGMPICAIVFSYAPRIWCRNILILFGVIAVIYSAIGIVESATHLRLLPFDPDWEVLKQDYFRASALMGHPLANAVFTAVSMFILMALRMPPALKAFIFTLMLVSLVGFGGRMALVGAVAGAIILGMIAIGKYFVGKSLTVTRMALAALAVLLVPALCTGLLYGVLHTDMGDRLMAYDSLQDDSAEVRVQSWQAIGQLSPAEMVFGVDSDRVAQIATNLGLVNPNSDIENPWILIFMMLGGIMFTLWGAGLAVFLGRLMMGASPALKIAIINYFVIASTSNSFGRKDSMFLLLPGLVVCAKCLTKLDNSKEGETYP